MPEQRRIISIKRRSTDKIAANKFEKSPGRLGRVVRRLAVAGICATTLSSSQPSAIAKINLPPDASLVAMGDSFTSGNNDGKVRDEHGNDIYEDCFTDAPSYADMVAEQLGIADFVKVACSGTTPKEILTGRYGNPPQIDALSEETDFVLLTIGANAINLSDLLNECLSSNCSADSEPMSTTLEYVSSEEYRQDIKNVFTEIIQRAPSAEILVVHYPDIMSNHESWCGTLVSPGVDAFVYEFIDRINKSLEHVVNDIDEARLSIVPLQHKSDLCSNLGLTFHTDPNNPRALGHPTKLEFWLLSRDVVRALSTKVER